ncbi:hypothetical protein KNE206_60180 [Kitasatospora sp. NE20-6]|uniref:hypothetical protein n=1 Tax=Kitasatospora sp. NE20-6 TaxID=2859066 RepID=UPI0034DBDAAC
MLPVGLLLLLATGAFTGLLIVENARTAPDLTLALVGHDTTVSTLEVFLAGIALALVFALGCALALAGRRRSARRSAELRAARKALRAARPGDAARPAAAARPSTTPSRGSATSPTSPVSRRRRLVQRLGL